MGGDPEEDSLNLETELTAELWASVRGRWEGRDFSGAILDGIYHLSDVIREKGDVEGDGVALVGQAFGGADPRIKLTRLHTETDRNVQAGTEALLRGIYQSIRNPRSHAKVTDTEADAAAILIFVSYLLRRIGEARSVFSEAAFLKRVFDTDFVASERYATLLAGEVPSKKRLDIALTVFRQRSHGEGDKLAHFFTALLPLLNESEQLTFSGEVSDSLKTDDDATSIRVAIQVLPLDHWMRLEEVVRLRLENKFRKSIAEGRYDERTGKCMNGAFGTWARRLVPHFLLRDELIWSLVGKLRSSDQHEQAYVFQFFFSTLAALDGMPSASLEAAILQGLKRGDKRFKRAAEYAYAFDETRGWSDEVMEALASFQDIPPDATGFAEPDDDLPF